MEKACSKYFGRLKQALSFKVLTGAWVLELLKNIIKKVGICWSQHFCDCLVEGSAMEAFSSEQSVTNSGTRMPQSPRRLTHQLPPRLNIHPASTSELGPPAQVQVWTVVCTVHTLLWYTNTLFIHTSDIISFPKLTLQRIPVRRVPQLAPGVSGTAVSPA